MTQQRKRAKVLPTESDERTKRKRGANGTASGQNALHWGDNQHPEQE